MIVNKTIQLNCSPEKLWEWLTDFEKLQKWNDTMLAEKVVSEGEPKEGFLSKILINEGKKNEWYENEILDYRPREFLRVALRGGSLGKSPMVVDYKIKDSGSQIELEYYCEWNPEELMLKLLHPLIKSMSIKNAENSLKKLKEEIEE